MATAADMAKHFRDMADAIDRNAEAGFGGAFVIVAPEGGGAAIETLILDSSQDMALFWNSVITKAQIMLTVAEKNQRGQSGFNR
jgi:hypothetical protein